MPAWLRNCWYMAGWSDEIGDAGLARTILDRPVFIYRPADGGIAALLDRCPHRFAPLSRGTREGDAIVCGYHGLTFSPAGKCVRNPFAERIPAGTDVPTFAAVERDGIVWLWGGNEQEADPALIADFSFVPDTPHSRTVRGYTLMQANYEYGTDNLLDLSHIEFVHKGSFAGNGVIFAGEHSVTEDGTTLHADWWMPDIPAPGHTLGAYDPAMRCDHWLEMRWDPPASMYLQIGACPHGGERARGVIAHQAHILTPETATTTHYFWASSRSMPPSDTGDAMLKRLMEQAFVEEDKPIIKAAFDNLDGADFWDMQPMFLGIDAGGTRARRMLQKLIAQERAGS